MRDEGVFLDEVVGFVQHGHEEVARAGIAAHEAVRVAGVDHLDGVSVATPLFLMMALLSAYG